MTPEAVILLVNASFLAFAYFWVYPNIREKKVRRLMTYSAAISAAALTVAGLLFWGSGTAFSLIVFRCNWAVFSLLTMAALEAPLFAWFAGKYDIDN